MPQTLDDTRMLRCRAGIRLDGMPRPWFPVLYCGRIPVVMRRGARRAVPLLLVLLVTAWGALVRVDALVERYGTLEHPGWARVLTHAAPRWASPAKPAAHQWRRIGRPYVGGDPINYLRYAREMQTFYQPHVREPVFLAITRVWLWLLGGADVAVSFASATGSTLAIPAAYLLTAAVVSPAAGIGVALLVAAEYDLITWGVDGWRDDTFTAFVLLAAWGFVRLRQRPVFGNALLAGFLAGGACLTRITALSFVVPALALGVVDAPRAEWRSRAAHAALAGFMCALVLGPFLLSCAIATGDPFFAINYHTGYYRFGEGLPADQPMTAASYVAGKLAGHPFRALDTAFQGLTTQPFETKFHGFEGYAPHVGAIVEGLAAAGLFLLPFTRAGRMLLVVLLSSLVPYAFTWNVSSGGEWRFTMHAYPLYLAAAALAGSVLVRGVQVLIRRVRSGERPQAPSRRLLAGIAAVVLAAACGAALYYSLPWLVVREALRLGEDASIETGARDRLFFRAGWTTPHHDGVVVRVSTAQPAVVRLPLPIRRDYDIVLRLDPVAPGRQRHAAVLFNRHLIANLALAFDPARMGSYRMRVPGAHVRVGSNELAIVPDVAVPAASSGRGWTWLDPAERVGIRLWYVRLLAKGP